MHGFFLLVPKIIVSQNGLCVIFDTQFTSPTVRALQITRGNFALVVFTMGSIKTFSTIAKVRFVLAWSFQTSIVIDTKFVDLVLTQRDGLVFTMFTDIELTGRILGVIAIAKILRIAVDIIQAGNAFATMKAFVSIIGGDTVTHIARLVRAVASKQRF